MQLWKDLSWYQDVILSLWEQNPKPLPILLWSTLLCIDNLGPNCQFRHYPSVEPSCLQDQQQQALRTPSLLLFASLACVTHSRETRLTLIARQHVDVFKLVSSLRRVSFKILICIISVFFLDDFKKYKTPVRSERSQVLNHGGSKQ